MLIKPGVGVDMHNSSPNSIERNVTTEDNLMDVIRNLVPPNIAQALMQQVSTESKYPDKEDNIANFSDIRTWEFKTGFRDGSNILGLVVCSLVFGTAIAVVGERAKLVLDFLVAFTEIIMVRFEKCLLTYSWTKVFFCSPTIFVFQMVVMFLINFVPLGVCSLAAEQVLLIKDYATAFKGLGVYMGTVVSGLFIQGLFILPAFYCKYYSNLDFCECEANRTF